MRSSNVPTSWKMDPDYRAFLSNNFRLHYEFFVPAILNQFIYPPSEWRRRSRALQQVFDGLASSTIRLLTICDPSCDHRKFYSPSGSRSSSRGQCIAILHVKKPGLELPSCLFSQPTLQGVTSTGKLTRVIQIEIDNSTACFLIFFYQIAQIYYRP